MRRWTGLVLRAALLLIGAAMLGRGLPAGVWRWVTPQHLLETAFRIETGAVRAPAETAAPEIFLAEPTPAMTPEPTSASDAPDRTPDGLPILPTSFPGGLTLRNATDYDPDLARLDCCRTEHRAFLKTGRLLPCVF